MTEPVSREQVKRFTVRQMHHDQYDEELVSASDYDALTAQREQAERERDNLRLRISAVDAEHADMERQKHKSIEAFQQLEAEAGHLRGQVALLQLALKQEEELRTFVQGQQDVERRRIKELEAKLARYAHWTPEHTAEQWADEQQRRIEALEQERDAWKKLTHKGEIDLRMSIQTVEEWKRATSGAQDELFKATAEIRTLTASLAQAQNVLEAVLKDAAREERYHDDAQDYRLFCGMHSDQHKDGCMVQKIKSALAALAVPAAAPRYRPGVGSYSFTDTGGVVAQPLPAGPGGWTDARPTVPGWYWWRCDNEDREPYPVQVFEYEGALMGEWQDSNIQPLGTHNGQWVLQPIAPPDAGEGRR